MPGNRRRLSRCFRTSGARVGAPPSGTRGNSRLHHRPSLLAQLRPASRPIWKEHDPGTGDAVPQPAVSPCRPG